MKNPKPNVSQGKQKAMRELAEKGYYYYQCRQWWCCSNNGCRKIL